MNIIEYLCSDNQYSKYNYSKPGYIMENPQTIKMCINTSKSRQCETFALCHTRKWRMQQILRYCWLK